MSRKSEALSWQSDPLPEDAEFLGHNRDVSFFRSPSEGVVLVVQGDVVWRLPLLAREVEER